MSQDTPEGWHFFEGRARSVALPRHSDPRGSLIPLEFEHLPFAPVRAFVVHGVPAGTLRGRHAHRRGRQVLLCLGGRVEVELRWGNSEAQCRLEPGGPALLIEPGVWAQQKYEGSDPSLLVLASDPYDPLDYLPEPGP